MTPPYQHRRPPPHLHVRNSTFTTSVCPPPPQYPARPAWGVPPSLSPPLYPAPFYYNCRLECRTPQGEPPPPRTPSLACPCPCVPLQHDDARLPKVDDDKGPLQVLDAPCAHLHLIGNTGARAGRRGTQDGAGTSVEAVVEHKPICMHRALNSRVALRVMASHFLHKLTLYQLDIGLKRAVDVAQTPALFFPIIPTSPSARRASAGDTHKVAVHTYEVCAHAQRCGRPWAPLEPQLTTLSAAPPTAASTPRTASAYR